MHYAIGDIHGCYQAMKKLIGKIEREDADAQFILIGDVIDRGGETPEVLEWCMKNVTRDGKYQMLMGNHELMFMEWCSREWFPYCEGKKKSYEHAHYHADEDLKKAGLLTEQSVEKIFSFSSWGSSLRNLREKLQSATPNASAICHNRTPLRSAFCRIS